MTNHTKVSRRIGAMLAGAAILACAGAAAAGTNDIRTTRIATGFIRPLAVTAPEGDFSRIFVVEQRGSAGTANRADIRIVNLPSNTVNPSPYLSVNSVSTGSEQGLLGLAFHPDFLNNGFFYVNYTNASGSTIIMRYQANAPFATSTSANAASATLILSIAQPFANHNGGWLGFGPDGYLYIATGDGGSGNDPSNNALNNNSLLGKMLRLDINGVDGIPGTDDDDGIGGNGSTGGYTSPADNPLFGPIVGRDEIWANGLRNPFGTSFDRLTGEIYYGDVGQDAEEEVSWQPANTPGTLPGDPGYMGGRNYGWKCYEGNFCKASNCAGCPEPAQVANRVNPIATYRNLGGGSAFAPFSFSGCSIAGGYVYRGCAIPDLQGVYFFSDYCTPQIWTFRNNNGTISEILNRTSQMSPSIDGFTITSITRFGEDAYGEMYIISQGGNIFKIVSTLAPPVDCDENGVNDPCQILANPGLDANNNGILDSCEPPPACPGDANGDLMIDAADLSVLLSNFGQPAAGPAFGDFNGDGQCNGADLSVLLSTFGTSCN